MIDFIVNVGAAFLVGYAVCCWFPPCRALGSVGLGCRKAPAGKGKRK